MYQSCTIVGNLRRDPEARSLPSGETVTAFSVAVTRRWTDRNGEPQETTTWFAVSAWGKLGDNCQRYLAKGRAVLVEGEVSARAYTAKDGTPRAALELRARNVTFLPSGSRDNGEAGNGTPHLDEALGVTPPAPRVVNLNRDEPGDIPF